MSCLRCFSLLDVVTQSLFIWESQYGIAPLEGELPNLHILMWVRKWCYDPHRVPGFEWVNLFHSAVSKTTWKAYGEWEQITCYRFEFFSYVFMRLNSSSSFKTQFRHRSAVKHFLMVLGESFTPSLPLTVHPTLSFVYAPFSSCSLCDLEGQGTHLSHYLPSTWQTQLLIRDWMNNA